MRLRLYFLILLSACFLLISCKEEPAEPGHRYVVLSPELAEIINALDASDEIIGITEECSYLPGLKGKEVVGDFGAIKMEKIMNLDPDIVFASALEQEAITLDLRKLGFRVETAYPRSINEMLEVILQIGEIIDRDTEARTLVDSLSAQIAVIKANGERFQTPKVYLEIYRDPLMSVADNSFVGELIETAGGDNVFETLERDYARVKAEDVISSGADIMICYSRDSLENIVSRKGWTDLPAIKNRMIFFEEDIDPDLIQRAGPRSIDGMHRLAEIYQVWQDSQQ